MSTTITSTAEWLNGSGIYARFALPRSLLHSLVDAKTVRMKPIETEFGTMFLYNVADCAAFVNGESGTGEVAK